MILWTVADVWIHTAELDIATLLAIQQVCSLNGIKIPWDQVAQTLGKKFTEGAIVQHLAKLRAKRLKEKKWVPDPKGRKPGAKGRGADAQGPCKKKKMSAEKPAAKATSGPKRNLRRGARNTILESSDEEDGDESVGSFEGHGQNIQSELPGAGSDGSGNYPEGYGAGQPWLTQFVENTGLGFDSDGHGYATGSSSFGNGANETSGETSSEGRRETVTVLKMSGKELARIVQEGDSKPPRYVDPNSLSFPVTPPQPMPQPRNQNPRRPGIPEYVGDDPLDPRTHGMFPIDEILGRDTPYYPSSGPNPYVLPEPGMPQNGPHSLAPSAPAMPQMGPNYLLPPGAAMPQMGPSSFMQTGAAMPQMGPSPRLPNHMVDQQYTPTPVGINDPNRVEAYHRLMRSFQQRGELGPSLPEPFQLPPGYDPNVGPDDPRWGQNERGDLDELDRAANMLFTPDFPRLGPHVALPQLDLTNFDYNPRVPEDLLHYAPGREVDARQDATYPFASRNTGIPYRPIPQPPPDAQPDEAEDLFPKPEEWVQRVSGIPSAEEMVEEMMEEEAIRLPGPEDHGDDVVWDPNYEVNPRVEELFWSSLEPKEEDELFDIPK